MPPPALLMEELVEEILLRLPPADPATLVRAAAVCKPWRRLVSAAAFRRRFREFHRRAPPVLGFLCNESDAASRGDPCTLRFVPALASSSVPPLAGRCRDLRGYVVVDARHGRVLLRGRPPSARGWMEKGFVVWDPIADEEKQLPEPPGSRFLDMYPCHWNAAVVCAATAGGSACDHADCRRGHFFVVCVLGFCTAAQIYSSETGAWSMPIFAPQPHDSGVYYPRHSALVGNALYFPTDFKKLS
ncbi:hypothetical protein ACP4OV_011846 [Aristida adscensionis]